MKRLQISIEEFPEFQRRASDANVMYQHSVSGEYVNIDALDSDFIGLGYKSIELSDVD